jgi:23S rRNA A1618 N6-methylase RlmF
VSDLCVGHGAENSETLKLRALSAALLKRDFGLDVHLPSDRLIPPVSMSEEYCLHVRLTRMARSPIG